MDTKLNNKIKDQQKLIQILIYTTIVIVILNIINVLMGEPFWQITRLINVDTEGNFPTWFSSMMLAIAAFYAYNCFRASKNNDGKIWKLLSISLVTMSCDEVAQIHEHLGNTINKYLIGLKNLNAAWLVIFGPFILGIIFIFVLKIKNQLVESFQAIKFLRIGLFVYLGGAFLLESTVVFLTQGEAQWLWNIEYIAEETLEMFGIIFIIKGLIEHHRFLLQKNS
ncbi:MAG: hypothetical protein ABIG64_09285 [Candidatus Omnitrophota bacterium]